MNQWYHIAREEFSSYVPFLLGLWLLNLYFILNAPILDVDAALYASMSMELIEKNNFLFLTERGSDYLDKPHLLFWLNAASFKMFGFSNWAYRLPSVLFFMLSMGYLYRFTALFLSKISAFYAVAVMQATLGFFWIASDLKTDLLLISFLIPAVFYLYKGIMNQSRSNLVYFSLFAALAMMTKGIMGLILPFILLSPFMIANYHFFRLFLRLRWWWTLPLSLALSSPVLIALYLQFDSHPEKIVHGREAVSGLRFFFWEQSFGRFTGENKWHNDAPWYYLFEQAFLLMMPFSLFLFSRNEGKKGHIGFTHPAYLFLIGAVVVLVLLSFSQYVIPHYAAVAFPFMAVYAGYKMSLGTRPFVWLLSATIVGLLSLAMAWAMAWHWSAVVLFCAYVICWLLIRHHRKTLVCISAFTLGLLLNAFAIPLLFEHTATSKVPELLALKKIAPESVVLFNKQPRSLEFALKQRLTTCTRDQVPEFISLDQRYLFYMDDMGLHDLTYDGLRIAEIHEFNHHDADRIQIEFLNPQLRHKALQKRYLVRFHPMSQP